MSRFDYVKYDENSMHLQQTMKNGFQEIEHYIEYNIMEGRAKSLIMTKLEEAYMWIGKAIRDDQIKRNGSAELEESRGNDSSTAGETGSALPAE